jgi:hypothetical protein
MTILLLLALFAPTLHAGPLGAIRHFLGTHKEQIFIDAVTIGAAAAESVTSQNCLADMRKAGVMTSTCTKQGMFELKISPALIAANHLSHRYSPTPAAKHIQAFWIAPFAAFAVDAAYTNVKVSSVGYLKQTWGKP